MCIRDSANIVLEMGYAADLHRGALVATGVVLFVFILLITDVYKRQVQAGHALLREAPVPELQLH